MTLTYSDSVPLTRTLWESPNGKWRLDRVAHDGRTRYRLRRHDGWSWYAGNRIPNETYATVYWAGNAAAPCIACDLGDELPAYVVAALERHTPGKPITPAWHRNCPDCGAAIGESHSDNCSQEGKLT